MVAICLYYVSRLFFKDFTKISSWFLLYFGKLETAIFKDHLSVATSENSYVGNTPGAYKNLPD